MPVAGLVDGSDQVNEARAGAGRVDAGDFATSAGDVIALRYGTAGTLRDLMDGWLAFVERRADMRDDVVGRVALVELPDGRRHLRQVRRGYEPGRYNLYGFGGEQLTDVRISSASPLLGMRAVH